MQLLCLYCSIVKLEVMIRLCDIESDVKAYSLFSRQFLIPQMEHDDAITNVQHCKILREYLSFKN